MKERPNVEMGLILYNCLDKQNAQNIVNIMFKWMK